MHRPQDGDGRVHARSLPGPRWRTPEEPKQVAKEGLSEYFIYTIEGTETIRNGWSKRMRSLEAAKVPFKIQYRYRPAEYGDQLVRMYLLTNDKDSKLGTTPLPDGTVRVFRQNGRDGLSFLVAQPVKYIPIGDKIELNLGPDPEVIFELIKLRTWRDTDLDAASRHERLSAGGPAGCADRGEQLGRGLETTIRSTASGSATTRRSRSTWKSAEPSPAMWSSAASFPPRTTTTRRSSTRPR